MCTHVSVVSSNATFLSFDLLFALSCGQKAASLHIYTLCRPHLHFFPFFLSFAFSVLHSLFSISLFLSDDAIGNNINRGGSRGRYNRHTKSHNKWAHLIEFESITWRLFRLGIRLNDFSRMFLRSWTTHKHTYIRTHSIDHRHNNNCHIFAHKSFSSVMPKQMCHARKKIC